MFSQRRSTLFNACAIAFVTLALAGCQRAPEVIKIGVAQPLSGPLADLGKDMVNGVQLAVDELNKKGFKVDGKAAQFEVVAIDDKADPAEAKKVAQQLVDAGVVAVVGHLTSGSSIEAAPVYAQKSIAQMAISTNPKFTELGHATAFRLVASDMMQARAVGSYSANQIIKTKFAVIDDGTVYGKSLAESAVKLLETKKTVVLRQSFDDKTKEFTALAAKMQADGVEVVLSTLGDFQVVALIEALEKIGYSKQITLVGTDTLKTSGMIAQANKVAAMFVTSPVLDLAELPGGAAFLSSYTKAFSKAPVYGSHYSYDAMQILAKAIAQEGVEPAKITAALHKMEGFAPVSGAMRWTELGEPRNGMVAVYTVRGTQWESIVRSDKW
jgi:branched-chain amino acid transport system substrate-binding protein